MEANTNFNSFPAASMADTSSSPTMTSKDWAVIDQAVSLQHEFIQAMQEYKASRGPKRNKLMGVANNYAELLSDKKTVNVIAKCFGGEDVVENLREEFNMLVNHAMPGKLKLA